MCQAQPAASKSPSFMGVCSHCLPLPLQAEAVHMGAPSTRRHLFSCASNLRGCHLHGFRYPTAQEVALLNGLSLSLPIGQDESLALALIGQLASPLQSACLLGALARTLCGHGVALPGAVDAIQILHTQRRILLREAEVEGHRPVTAGHSLLLERPAICFERQADIDKRATSCPSSIPSDKIRAHFVPERQNTSPFCPRTTKYEPILSQNHKIRALRTPNRLQSRTNPPTLSQSDKLQIQFVPERQNTSPFCPGTTKYEPSGAGSCNAEPSPIPNKSTHFVPSGQPANPVCPKATKYEATLSRNDKIRALRSRIL